MPEAMLEPFQFNFPEGSDHVWIGLLDEQKHELPRKMSQRLRVTRQNVIDGLDVEFPIKAAGTVAFFGLFPGPLSEDCAFAVAGAGPWNLMPGDAVMLKMPPVAG